MATSHHRALVLEQRGEDFQVKELPIPEATPGSAVVKILHVGVLSYHHEIFGGQRPYPYPTPLIGGMSAIGRIAALGHDSVALKQDELVYVDCVIHGRDDPSAMFLSAIHEGMSGGSRKLMREVWRNGTFAEYAKMPLENCIPLDETKLCKNLGYKIQDLTYIGTLLVAFGGLRDIGLQAGETIIVCPATGNFGGAGVLVAIAMGANVIAMGRNEKELSRLEELVQTGKPGCNIQTLKIAGEEQKDTSALQAFGNIDAVLDLTPPHACKSTHLKSAIKALRRGGRCSMMGYVEDVVDWSLMANSITLKGKLMYERDDILHFVKMLESGLFPIEECFVVAKSFGLEQWKEAFHEASEYTGMGRQVIIGP